MAEAKDEQEAEKRYWLARMVETPYQNPQEFMYCGKRTDNDYHISNMHWLRCVR